MLSIDDDPAPPTTGDAFRPVWWAAATHAQTIGGRLLRPRHGVAFRRERLDTPDGDFVDLDHANFDLPAGAPLVLLLHGLEGSARRGYAVMTYRELAAVGIRAVGLNFRSCSGEPNRTARFYHSGDTGDVRYVVAHLAAREPGTPLGAIGFSLGGNALLKYLAEEADAAMPAVRAAVAVSVPYDLAAGAGLLERTAMGRFYTRHFLRSLKRKMRAKAPLMDGCCDLERVVAARTFREFDDAATAPIHGFTGADDYYGRSGSGPLLHRIRVPTLLIHAEDDPFVPPDAVPGDAVAANPYLEGRFSRRGGHVGFIAGSAWGSPRFWAERAAATFFARELRSGDGG